jgi:hypothetical protein
MNLVPSRHRSSVTAACVRWIIEPQNLLAIPGQRNDAIVAGLAY